MSKPHFRALAAVRLNAERSQGLSQDVLRLLSADGRTLIPSAAVSDISLDKSDTRPNPPYENPPGEATPYPLIGGGGAVDDGLTDPATGLASLRVWSEVLRNEENRFARQGRPVTLVVAELNGLDSLAVWFGWDTADRLIAPLARVMRQSARAADVIARTGPTRFVAMLPETDEIAATNYTERVRSQCDMWLEAGAIAVRLAVGWAQPVAGGRLADALRLADERMKADRSRRDFGAAGRHGHR
ncbi:MAG: GGDEF domain-containing protein [Candidatus Limnocylindrales bacterium]